LLVRLTVPGLLGLHVIIMSLIMLDRPGFMTVHQ